MKSLFKSTLILIVGLVLGYQFSKSDVLPKMEVGVLAKSEAQEKLDKIIVARELKSLSSVEKLNPKESMEVNHVDGFQLSVHDLSEVLEKKRTNLYESQYQKLIPTKEGEEEARLDYFNKMAKAFDVSNYWLSHASLQIKDDSVPVLLRLEFYNTSANDETFTSKDIESIYNVCWSLDIVLYPENSEKKSTLSSGDCVIPTNKEGISYFVFPAHYHPQLNKYFSYLLFPLPQDFIGPYEYISDNESNWSKGSIIQWESISKAESEELIKKYGP